MSFTKTSICLCLLSLGATLGATDYEWSTVEKGDAFLGLRVTGRVVPQDGALNIESASVPGRILGILRREGETVEKGTPLFSINSAECISLREETRVAQGRKLPDLIEGVQRRGEQLGIQVDGDQCLLLSQYEGIVTKRSVESGSVFNQGDPLVTIVDIRRLGVEMDVAERDLNKLRLGQEVKFRLASDSKTDYTSQIATIVPVIDPATRTSRVRLKSVTLPRQITLDTLVFGEVITGRDQPILKIPSTALVFNRNRQFVIKGDARNPVAVAVQVISESDNTSSVRPVEDGSLKQGDSIVSKGALFLFSKMNG
jgi:Cu(I)/Ag(I) efflux system membrane fusion protein